MVWNGLGRQRVRPARFQGVLDADLRMIAHADTSCGPLARSTESPAISAEVSRLATSRNLDLVH